MLYAWTAIVVAKLLDLTLALARGWLIDRHLDFLVEVGHDYGTERTVVRVNHLVIDGPETVEIKHSLVPLSCRLHLAVLLVADDVVNVKELGDGDQTIESFSLRMIDKAWQEWTVVSWLTVRIDSLDERVDSVTVRLDRCDDHFAIGILQNFRFAHTRGAPTHCLLVDSCGVIDRESNIFDTVSMLCMMR